MVLQHGDICFYNHRIIQYVPFLIIYDRSGLTSSAEKAGAILVNVFLTSSVYYCAATRPCSAGF